MNDRSSGRPALLNRERTRVLEKMGAHFLRSLLLSIARDGQLETDGDAVVLTNHLIRVLRCYPHPHLRAHLERATRWFLSLEDPRDSDPKDLAPFKLAALASDKRARSRSYVVEKARVLREYHVRSGGYAVLQIGAAFVNELQDVFPTLMAAEILMAEGSEESLLVARASLDWVIDQFQGQAVHKNTSASMAFAALQSLVFARTTGEDHATSWRAEILIELCDRQDSGLWEDSLYQTSYVFYDLAEICTLDPGADVSDALLGTIDHLPTMLEREAVSPQTAAITRCSFLRGFACLLSTRSRNRLVQDCVRDILVHAAALDGDRQQVRLELARARDFNRWVAEHKYVLAAPRIFKARQVPVNEKQAFVLMPFGKKKWMWRAELGPREDEYDFDGPYNRIISPVIEELGLQSVRADSIFAPDSLMEKIWRQINESSLIIADLTGMNPNVLYELGIGHTLGKPIIILTQSGKDLPTDLKGHEYIEYSRDLGSEDELRGHLRRAIEDTMRLVYGVS